MKFLLEADTLIKESAPGVLVAPPPVVDVAATNPDATLVPPVVVIDEVAVMLSNTYMLNEYFQDILAKYNVYKESIEGVEEEQFLSTVAAMIDFKHSYTADIS